MLYLYCTLCAVSYLSNALEYCKVWSSYCTCCGIRNASCASHQIKCRLVCVKSRDSSVGIVLGYALDDRGSRVRFPEVAGNFSLHHCVQNGSCTHPASYPIGTRGSFPGGKAAGS
jgi:hypothetical protein